MHQQQERKTITVKVALFVLRIAMQCMLQLKQYVQSLLGSALLLALHDVTSIYRVLRPKSNTQIPTARDQR